MNVLKSEQSPLIHGNILIGYKPLIPEGSLFYYGLVPAIDDDTPRPLIADFLLSEFNQGEGSYILSFADYIGWMVILIPVSETLSEWFVGTNNKGLIGGDYDDTFSKLFPDGEIGLVEGQYFKVYISSYPTRITDIVLS